MTGKWHKKETKIYRKSRIKPNRRKPSNTCTLKAAHPPPQKNKQTKHVMLIGGSRKNILFHIYTNYKKKGKNKR